MPYKQPPPSPIEVSFWEVASLRIPDLQREVWIDNKYRVDFLVPKQKVIIELYGYEHHKEKWKLTKDAQRERYLQKNGYQVLRFTGSEIYKDVHSCVNEVLAIINNIQTSKGAERAVEAQVIQARMKPNQTASSVTDIPKPLMQSKIKLAMTKWQLAVLSVLSLATIGVFAVLTMLVFKIASQPASGVALSLVSTPTLTFPPSPTLSPFLIPTPLPETMRQLWGQQIQIVVLAMCLVAVISIPLIILGLIGSLLRGRFRI
jgi:very-short-patch-repair endonuclease